MSSRYNELRLRCSINFWIKLNKHSPSHGSHFQRERPADAESSSAGREPELHLLLKPKEFLLICAYLDLHRSNDLGIKGIIRDQY